MADAYLALYGSDRREIRGMGYERQSNIAPIWEQQTIRFGPAGDNWGEIRYCAWLTRDGDFLGIYTFPPRLHVCWSDEFIVTVTLEITPNWVTFTEKPTVKARLDF